MALGSTVSVSQIKTELGISTPNNISSLNVVTQNPYSFYRPNSIQPNASTKVIEMVNDVSPFNLGDWRYYNNASTTPTVQANYTQNYPPSTNPLVFTVGFLNQSLNVKELSNSITHLNFRVYSDAGFTSLITSSNQPISFGTITPPTGHRNNQTQQASSTQTIPSISVSNPDIYSTLYCQTWFSDSGANLIAKLPSNTTTITLHKYTDPTINIQTLGSIPAGFTGVFATLVSESLNYGDTTLTFTFNCSGVNIPNPSARVSADVKLTYIYGGTTYTIADHLSISKTSNTTISSWALPTGDQGNWDETKIIYIYFYSASF